MIQFLKGKKSFIIASLGAVLSLLKATGKITPELYEALMGLLASGAVAAVRAAINRI